MEVQCFWDCVSEAKRINGESGKKLIDQFKVYQTEASDYFTFPRITLLSVIGRKQLSVTVRYGAFILIGRASFRTDLLLWAELVTEPMDSCHQVYW